MAQGYRDWTTDTIGAAPADMTVYWGTSPNFTVENYKTLPALRQDDNWKVDRRGIAFDLAGSTTGDQELYFTFYFPPDTPTDKSVEPLYFVALRAQGTTDRSGYLLLLRYKIWGVNAIEIRRGVSNEETAIATSSSPTWALDTKYHCRFSLESNVVTARIWEDGQTEPGATGNDTTTFVVSVDDSASAITGAGRIQLGDLGDTRGDVFAAYVSAGWGTNGDPAPTGPIVASTPTLTAKITGITATSAVPVIDVEF